LPLSPLLTFALESFEEAVEQYIKGTDKSRRFSILHSDQSIELILKEKIRSMGESIYVKGSSSKTVEYQDMLNNLRNNKGIKIPEYPDLEMIHDARNVIQHKGVTVSEKESEFYIKTTYDFLKRFLNDELKLDLFKVIDRRYYGIFEPAQKIENIFESKVEIHDKVASEVRRRSPMWILPTYANLEKSLLEQGKKFELGSTDPKYIIEEIIKRGKLSQTDSVTFTKIRDLRNKYAHTIEPIQGDQVEEFLKLTEELLKHIKKL
jgi:uncharacterized protein YutE (UPF0331/DUF86 family)